MKETCQECKYWASSGSTRGKDVGTCRIRSTPGSFPARYHDEWCGEYVAVDTKKVTPKEAEKPKKEKPVYSKVVDAVPTEQPNVG